MRRPAHRKATRAQRTEISFLEGIHGRGEHALVLEALGDLYTRTGRFEDGRQMDERLVRIRETDPTAWYNLGCSYSMTGRPDDAIAALRRAVELGYRDAGWMTRDSDLDPIRDDPRFGEILRGAHQAGP